MIRSIEKKTGTYADALEAIGWATLLQELGVKKLRIHDEGTCFVLRGEGEPDFTLPASLGFCFVSDAKNPRPEIADWAIDYERERSKEEAQREFEKAVKKKAKGVTRAAEAGELEAPDRPSPELKLAKMVSSMRKGWNADRDLAVWIGEHPEMTTGWIEATFEARSFKDAPDLSNTQLLNPSTGKGVSAAKTQAKAPNSVPGVLMDPFAEWMKLRGMWQGLIAYRSDEDFKFMVIEPGGISPGDLKMLREALEALNLWGGIRLDIEATLKLTRLLVEYSDVRRESGGVSLRGTRPGRVVRGLRQAYFKSLGTAAALMNEALLPLPEWFDVQSRTDADVYLRIIDETVGDKVRGGCLGILDEEKSDDGAVLQQYRAWLGSGDFEDLMEFHYQFGALGLRKAAAGEFTRQFRSETLDELLVRTYEETHMLKEIIEDEGFRSIARAIRNTTIYAVGMKSSNREIQFGLAQKWKQKMHGDEGEFAAALADFVQANNWEVAHKLEGKGFQVSATHLDSVFGLIEKHGEEKVGSLLLAYGYSRAPKVDDEVQQAEQVQS